MGRSETFGTLPNWNSCGTHVSNEAWTRFLDLRCSTYLFSFRDVYFKTTKMADQLQYISACPGAFWFWKI